MLSRRQQQCLKGIGIRQWLERSISRSNSEAIQPPVVVAQENIEIIEHRPAETPAIVSEPVKLDSWDDITQSIHQCQACELASSCTQKVPGVGDPEADLMIIGEGPGHEEDLKGEPFVGRSGQLLDKMLMAIGIARSQVFITNIVKCRPPNNRDPHINEVKACEPFIQAQIKQIAPSVILAVGRISAHHLLLPGSEIPLKVTYHPAYLLRNPSAKSIVWRDMKNLHKMLN